MQRDVLLRLIFERPTGGTERVLPAQYLEIGCCGVIELVCGCWYVDADGITRSRECAWGCEVLRARGRCGEVFWYRESGRVSRRFEMGQR